MNLWILWCFHFLSIAVCLLMTDLGRISCQRDEMAFAFIIPVVGPCCLLFSHFKRSRDYKPARKKTVKSAAYGEDTAYVDISYEEAFLTCPENERRRILMDCVRRHGDDLPRVIRLALDSDDQELNHIGAACAMNLATEIENDIAYMENSLENNPRGDATVRVLLNAVNIYIESGLIQGGAKRDMTRRLDKILNTFETREALSDAAA